MKCRCFYCEMERLTLAVSTYANFLELERKLNHMPIDLTGIRGRAMKARANWDGLSSDYAKLDADITAHRSDVQALGAELPSMQGDLEAAVRIMGNASGHDGEAVERPQPPPAPIPAAKPENAQEAAGTNPAGTFPVHPQ